ncbi:group 10 secretory phospholipase A2 [Cimex lectularius]|uniref:Phospholipase A2 n=1 Tax=Cimex lectularius TaxID=79782 RepID=A0A8I6RZF1_CIMLE|nr:group 10 secretory phospholipase A2 [Cimex lectularius]XP_014254445.1 group 10 secretory phospholipase A2 [Cimex lectularius]XP_014254447.1 group 10 secretory phospholipase A2 [Cimex lectularius]
MDSQTVIIIFIAFLTIRPTISVKYRRLNSTDIQVFLSRSNDPFGASAELKDVGQARGKRSVVNLYNVVSCATGCNPLSYKGYGCYCGFLGSGYPKDPIDSCCKMHDACYNAANCPMFLEYFVPYYWTCINHRPLCGRSSNGRRYSCGERLCECDRRLAECLARYPCPRSKAVCTSSPWRLLQNFIML